MSHMKNATVLVLDDNQAFCESVAWLLEGHGFRVISFNEPDQALTMLAGISPSDPACVLLDIRMPAMSGLDLHDVLHRDGIDIPVIYMSGHADVPIAVSAMNKGAITLLQKPLDDEQLLAALEKAFSPRVQCQRQSAADHAMAAERLQLLNTLTTRESEVLHGVVDGSTARQIAEQLSISTKTVDYHKGNLMRKLKASNVAQLQRIVSTAGVDL